MWEKVGLQRSKMSVWMKTPVHLQMIIETAQKIVTRVMYVNVEVFREMLLHRENLTGIVAWTIASDVWIMKSFAYLRCVADVMMSNRLQPADVALWVDALTMTVDIHHLDSTL